MNLIESDNMKESICICAYSGTRFKVQHFNLKLTASEVVHPIFYTEQKKLFQYVYSYNQLQLTLDEEWMLFLALLHSTKLVEFRVSAQHTEDSTVLIAEYLNKLAEIAVKLSSISNCSVVFPKLVVTKENCTLANIGVYIESLVYEYENLQDSYIRSAANKKAAASATSLSKFIKNSSLVGESSKELEASYSKKASELKKYSKQIAEWAATVGYFPEHQIVIRGVKQTCSEYWKHIIRCCIDEEKIFSIEKSHIETLLAFCELEIPAGTIYHFHLMKLLRSGLAKHTNFLGADLSDTNWKELDADASPEEASKLSIIMTAPKEAPKEADYPTKFAYTVAKLKYDMAQEYALKQAVAASTLETQGE